MKKIVLLLFIGLSVFKSSAQQTEGDAFFGAPQVHDIYLTFYQTNYWDSLVAGYTADTYIKGDITIDDSIMVDCGVKFKGNSSYNNPSNKKSFKLDFNNYVSGQKHDGLKKLNLNNCFKDPTFMREKLMLDFLNYRGLPSPRCTYARVYLNGTYWGLYTVVEEIDKTFLKDRFDDKKGNLFKGDPSGDMKWLGSSPTSYYTKYELKTNETQNDWSDLVMYLDKLNNTSTTVLPDTLANYLNLDDYYYTWATHVLFSNLDSYLGSGHNYYIYHDSTLNIFQFISWDVNEAFGNFNQGMNVSQIEAMNIFYVPTPAGNRPLHEKLLVNASAKQRLADALCDLVNYDFSIWTLEAKIDSIANAIRTDVYADPNKFFTNQNFEDNIENMITVTGNPGGNDIPGIKSFLTNRRNSVATQLATFGCTVGVNETEQNDNISVYPQPAEELITVKGLPTTGIWNATVYNAMGQLVYSGTLNSGNTINVSDWGEKGLYFLYLSNSLTNSSFIRKILKL